MRRFECTEDGARKFWQIAMNGTTLTVTFGKIGTAGQTKPKELPTPEKARAEHDKLVAEKLKKGYVEVDAAGAAPTADPAAAPAAAKPAAETVAPAQAPASSPAAPDAPEGGVVWTEQARARVHPRRSKDRARLSPPALDRGALFQKIRTPFLGFSARLKADPKWLGKRNLTLTEAISRTLSALEPPALPLKVDVEAACASALVGTHVAKSAGSRRPATSIDATFVDYWVVSAGPAFAARALAGTILRTLQTLKTTGDSLFLRDRDQFDTRPRPWFDEDFVEGWARLRRHLVTSDDAAYDEALRAARDIREGAPAPVRCALAFAFPDEAEWAREALAARGGPYFAWNTAADPTRPDSPQHVNFLWSLLTTFTDPAQVRAVIDLRLELAQGQEGAFSLDHHTAHVFTLVDTLGVAAVEPLKIMLENLTGAEAAKREGVAQALALIRTREVAEVMTGLLKQFRTREIAQQYFLDAPHLAPKPVPWRAPESAVLARQAARKAEVAGPSGLPESLISEFEDWIKTSGHGWGQKFYVVPRGGSNYLTMTYTDVSGDAERGYEFKFREERGLEGTGFGIDLDGHWFVAPWHIARERLVAVREAFLEYFDAEVREELEAASCDEAEIASIRAAVRPVRAFQEIVSGERRTWKISMHNESEVIEDSFFCDVDLETGECECYTQG